MKKNYFYLILTFIIVSSCEDDSLNSTNNNQEYLHSSTVCETCTNNYSWNYNYNTNNQLESIVSNQNFESIYEFYYDVNTNRLEEVIQEQATFVIQSTLIDGYVVTTFSYTNNDEFIGYIQHFNNNDELVDNRNVKYIFNNTLLKELTYYRDDINNPYLIQNFVHDEEGKLLYYDNISNSGTTRYEILSWVLDFKSLTIGMFGIQYENNTLEFFPNHLISSKLPIEYKSYSTTTDLGEATFVNIDYDFVINDYPSSINFTHNGNIILSSTYEYLLAN